jgi:hypothetical protein
VLSSTDPAPAREDYGGWVLVGLGLLLVGAGMAFAAWRMRDV